MSEQTTRKATAEDVRMITNPRELIKDVGDWAVRQPWNPRHAPDLGVIEEIGELTHGALKHYQGIRGFDSVDFYRKHMLDALGDIMVYLSHWCYLKNTHFTPHTNVQIPASMELRDCIQGLVVGASKLMIFHGPMGDIQSATGTVASDITHYCQLIARMFGWDLLDDCLYPTWHRVRLRDFNLDPHSGGRDQIEQEHGAPSTAPRLEAEAVALDPAEIEGSKPLEGLTPLEKKR